MAINNIYPPKPCPCPEIPGPAGPQGPIGPQGPQGDPGPTVPFAAEINESGMISPPPPGIGLATTVTGGVGTLSYEWSFANKTTIGISFGVYTTIPASFTTPTNTYAVGIAEPLAEELIVCTVRCKITDETGGPANPLTNLVTYAYFSLFVTSELPPP